MPEGAGNISCVCEPCNAEKKASVNSENKTNNNEQINDVRRDRDAEKKSPASLWVDSCAGGLTGAVLAR